MTSAISRAPAVAPLRRTGVAWRYVLLAIIFAVAAAYQTGQTLDIIHGLKVSIPYFAMQDAGPRVEGVKPHTEADGLRRGDIVIAINGRPNTGGAVLAQEEVKATPGTDLVLTVSEPNRESGQEQVRTIYLPVTRASRKISESAVPIVLLIIIPAICIILGCWVVLVRPRDRLAWLLLALLLGFTQLFGERDTQAWPPIIREAAMSYHIALATSWPIFMFLFGFYFPEPFPEGNRVRRWLKPVWWLVLVPVAASGVVEVAVLAGQISSYSGVAPLYRAASPLETAGEVLSYLAVSGFFCFIFMKSAGYSQLAPDARRRLRLLYWGTTVAMTPALALAITAAVLRRPFELFPEWITYPALFMLVLFPLTLAYVIVVQRAMDVRVVLRQGLQYGLAKGGIRVMQFIVSGLVVLAAFAMATQATRDRPQKLIVIFLGVTAIFTVRRGAEKLRTWTDRRFFREAYDAERVLSELSDNVRSIVETRPLIETVAGRISETLHIPHIAVLLGSSGPFRPAYALGYGTPPDVIFPLGGGTVKALEKQKEPARVYLDDPESWLYRDPAVSEKDRASLAQLDAELLLPLSARDKLLGFISLGPKRSDEPYSSADVRLLKSVAAQTGLALENARLMSAIADEVAQREVLNREVEIAREVQERLFPQKFPLISGIDYAGACRPALGVGGDYYDFLALPGGQLGIAVGDVSGKGIAAALMMASLQASLRGEATRAPANLAVLISNVNRQVFETSSSNRYATFFYAQYNPATRQLTYVNAGHNPPMLFHGSDGAWQVTRLETGGTVVGLLESSPYQQASLTIAPGDIFVAFTDGISEAMNNADEEWGEDQLAETIKACDGLTPSEIIARVMQTADTFVAGAKQHDDMTLVVLRSQPERL
jgi:sigma-B regulation protein RsbU (phosphoserine phosphatase)